MGFDVRDLSAIGPDFGRVVHLPGNVAALARRGRVGVCRVVVLSDVAASAAPCESRLLQDVDTVRARR